jgi:hypothetical protein
MINVRWLDMKFPIGFVKLTFEISLVKKESFNYYIFS